MRVPSTAMLRWYRERRNREGAKCRLSAIGPPQQKTDPLAQIGFPYCFRIAWLMKRAGLGNYLIEMVGGAGFEPATLAV
jgi:hypothetical protein